VFTKTFFLPFKRIHSSDSISVSENLQLNQLTVGLKAGFYSRK